MLGKHSGRHAFRERLEEMGYQLSDEKIQRAYERFIELADQKKHVTDRDIQAIVEEEIVAVPEFRTGVPPRDDGQHDGAHRHRCASGGRPGDRGGGHRRWACGCRLPGHRPGDADLQTTW